MEKLKFVGLIIGILCLGKAGFAQEKLVEILSEELNREYTSLQEKELPAYYIDYRVDENKSISISSSFGSLTQSNDYQSRVLTATVKVGSYELDNTHVFENDMFGGYERNIAYNSIPIEDNAYAIKQNIWKVTDWAYKNALSSYKSIKERIKTSEEEKKSDDFSKEKAVEFYDIKDQSEFEKFDKGIWEKRIKEYSQIFVDDKSILSADAMFSYQADRKYFVSSEGSKVVQDFLFVQLYISAQIKSMDGDLLPYNKSYYAFNPSGLPAHEEILADMKAFKENLIKLKEAPVAEPYTGPAILSAEAAGVFFHEIFGHRIEGHRLKSNMDGQTFKDKINDYVLPKEFKVTFDPSVKNYKGTDLYGHYKYDDEGVEGKKTIVVEDGLLKGFLMSRTPIEGFDSSCGHGRAQPGAEVVSRQSNMFIESEKAFSEAELRKKLIKACKKQKKEYGYYFKEVIGGFTITNRFIPNVFNIIPIEVYKIYVDGRPDELVRGVDLIGTPLTMFSKIRAAGTDKAVFNGYCGAESGSIPVSTISPALYVEQIETQLKPVSKIKLPILPRPGINQKEQK